MKNKDDIQLKVEEYLFREGSYLERDAYRELLNEIQMQIEESLEALEQDGQD